MWRVNRNEWFPVLSGGGESPGAAPSAPGPAGLSSSGRSQGQAWGRGRGGGRAGATHPLLLQQGEPAPLDCGALPGQRSSPALVEGRTLECVPDSAHLLVLLQEGDRRGSVADPRLGRGVSRSRCRSRAARKPGWPGY